MHSYLRAIGYSNIKTTAEMDDLVKKVLYDRNSNKVTESVEDFPLREYSRECAPNIGLTVRCEMDYTKGDEGGTPARVLNYFPFLHGSNISMQEELFASKKVDTRAYDGMCDDGRLGVSLIFYMQNVVDFLNYRAKDKGRIVKPVMVSALSLEGKIILPTEVYETNPSEYRRFSEKHAKLVNDAQKGDPVAIESLTKENMDMYAEVVERSRTEDVFSIVSTTFVPYGAESDVYSMVGIIEDYKYTTNCDTNEKLCVLTVSCNSVLMDICINAEDLLGEPALGRRFRGIVWVQGLVDFS